MGKYDSALKDLSRAIELDSELASAYNNRGNCYRALGKYNQAFSDYAAAIERKADYADAYNNRGLLYEELGRFDLARNDLNRAIELSPEDARAYKNLAWLLATCPDSRYRDGQGALSNARRACDLWGWKDFNALAALAASYAEAGQFTAAVDWQTTAISLAPAGAKADLRSRLELYQAGKPYRRELRPG